MIDGGNRSQLGEGHHAASQDEEKEKETLAVSLHSRSKHYERLILGLGISALVCLLGLVLLRLLGQISMLLFLLTVAQLITIGGLFGVRAAGALILFHVRRRKGRLYYSD